MAISSNKAECKWRWERVDPASTGASGDIAKLFKNDLVKVPGLLAAKDAPSPEAVLMAREVVQNSWDAAREARDATTGGGGIVAHHLCGVSRLKLSFNLYPRLESIANR